MAAAALGRRRAAPLAMGLALGLSLACASMEPPGGGPIDRTPPRLAAAWPESAAVGLGRVTELRLRFSEKVQRLDAGRFVVLYPPIEVEQTRWHGRAEATLRLAEPLPPDTVIVVELPPGLKDDRQVATRAPMRYPLATAARLPDGELRGIVLLDGKPLPTALIELHAVAPETLRLFQQTPLRRAWSDSTGAFCFSWLPAPGGPWLLRVFDDRNLDRRPGPGEAQRVMPDTVRLAEDAPRRDLGRLPVFGPQTPGVLAGVAGATPPWTAPLYGWLERIADGDTGAAIAPRTERDPGQRRLQLGARATWDRVAPGLVRLFLFADLDGDSLFGVLPDTAGGAPWLEPHAVLDSLLIEPGLETLFPAPRFPATLQPWRGPLPASPDTGAAALPEPAGAAADTARGG